MSNDVNTGNLLIYVNRPGREGELKRLINNEMKENVMNEKVIETRSLPKLIVSSYDYDEKPSLNRTSN